MKPAHLTCPTSEWRIQSSTSEEFQIHGRESIADHSETSHSSRKKKVLPKARGCHAACKRQAIIAVLALLLRHYQRWYRAVDLSNNGGFWVQGSINVIFRRLNPKYWSVGLSRPSKHSLSGTNWHLSSPYHGERWEVMSSSDKVRAYWICGTSYLTVPVPNVKREKTWGIRPLFASDLRLWPVASSSTEWPEWIKASGDRWWRIWKRQKVAIVIVKAQRVCRQLLFLIVGRYANWFPTWSCDPKWKGSRVRTKAHLTQGGVCGFGNDTLMFIRNSVASGRVTAVCEHHHVKAIELWQIGGRSWPKQKRLAQAKVQMITKWSEARGDTPLVIGEGRSGRKGGQSVFCDIYVEQSGHEWGPFHFFEVIHRTKDSRGMVNDFHIPELDLQGTEGGYLNNHKSRGISKNGGEMETMEGQR